MIIAHNKNILIFLLSSIGLITFPHITHIPGTLFAFFYLLLGFDGNGHFNWNNQGLF